jgi:hypothetical protein
MDLIYLDLNQLFYFGLFVHFFGSESLIQLKI